MKNLKINSAITTKNDAEIMKELQAVLKICFDTLNEIIYFAVGYYKIVAINRQKKIVNIIEVPIELGIDQNNKLLRFDYYPEDQRLCLVFAQGQILIVHIEEKKVEKIFDLGKNIIGCSWSPDLQLLVIASENQLFIVTRVLNHQDSHQFFKILAETIIRPTSSGKDQLVTIRWGSAETQFQGSVGKQNREKKDPNKIPIAIRNEFDDKKVLISWRADGQYFAVSSVDDIIIPKQESPTKNIVVEKMNCRQLRIWNRDLELMSRCEFLSGMEAALCMRPTGNLIAVPRILENERFIWFFERNGQYRNKFKLPTPKQIDDLALQSVVDYVSWNLDSTILAILFHDKKNGFSQLQFWTVSNYSWTMKLCLNVENGLVDQCWDTESMNKFHYVTMDGNYNQILLQFEYNCESILAFSINGDNICVTDFKMATIPPPLCHMNLPLDYSGTPSAFAFSFQFGLAVIGSDFQRMTIFYISDREFQFRANLKLNNFKLLHNLEWANQNSIRALRNGMDTNQMEIINISLETEQINIIQLLNLQIIFAHLIVNNSSLPWLGNFCLLQHEIVNCDLNENKSLLLGQSTMNLAYEQFYQIKKLETEKTTLIFTLTNTFLFFVNNKKLHLSIGSFCFSKNFLLLLTLGNNSNLFCIPVEAILTFLAKDVENADDLLKSGRQIENGAQLIACEGTKVWLQMPRGNLEVISPRELVLDELKVHLNAGNWRIAYIEMRRHRVTTDLLYDHNPKTFNENVAGFVNQIDNVDHLNQFLTTLQSEDTTLEMFSAQYSERRKEIKPSRKLDEKINGICEKIRNVILNIADDEKQKVHLYPVVLTTFIVEKPSRISAALLNMRDFLSKLNCADSLTQTIQRWLRHMCYMVSEESLFREALKTYDMEIALLVAQSTNMDPKEYLPILNDFRLKTPDLLRFYHIELFLGDWKAALEQIAKLVQGEPENSTYLQMCLDLIINHKILHYQALGLFCGKPHYKDICKIVASELESKGSIKEAALLYEKADEYLSAQNCLFNVQDFRGFLRLSKLAGQPREKIEPLMKKMVIQLEHRDKFAMAAEILTYLGKEANAEKILDLYSKENAWTKLMEFLNETGGEFLTNKCRVTLSMRCMQIIEKIDEWRDIINKYWKRLDVLRKAKAEKLAKICANEEEEDFRNDGDTSSQASNSSLNSRKTHMSTATSSRKRKQNERKKQQIKEGSQWEDAALLVALKGIYSSIYRQQDELVELLPPLVSLDLIDKGRRLQKEMIEFLCFAHELIGKIWPDHLYPYHLPGPITNIYTDKENVFKLPLSGRSGSNQINCIRQLSGKFFETIEDCDCDALMPFGLHLEDEIQRPEFISTYDCQWKLNILY